MKCTQWECLVLPSQEFYAILSLWWSSSRMVIFKQCDIPGAVWARVRRQGTQLPRCPLEACSCSTRRQGQALLGQQLAGAVPVCRCAPGSRRLSVPAGQSCFVSLLIAACREGEWHATPCFSIVSNADTKKIAWQPLLGLEPALLNVLPIGACKNLPKACGEKAVVLLSLGLSRAVFVAEQITMKSGSQSCYGECKSSTSALKANWFHATLPRRKAQGLSRNTRKKTERRGGCPTRWAGIPRADCCLQSGQTAAAFVRFHLSTCTVHNVRPEQHFLQICSFGLCFIVTRINKALL